MKDNCYMDCVDLCDGMCVWGEGVCGGVCVGWGWGVCVSVILLLLYGLSKFQSKYFLYRPSSNFGNIR